MLVLGFKRYSLECLRDSLLELAVNLFQFYSESTFLCPSPLILASKEHLSQKNVAAIQSYLGVLSPSVTCHRDSEKSSRTRKTRVGGAGSFLSFSMFALVSLLHSKMQCN